MAAPSIRVTFTSLCEIPHVVYYIPTRQSYTQLKDNLTNLLLTRCGVDGRITTIRINDSILMSADQYITAASTTTPDDTARSVVVTNNVGGEIAVYSIDCSIHRRDLV